MAPAAGPRRRRGPAGAGPRPVPRPARARHDLQHPDPAAAGREGPRLVRVREAGLEARQLLPDADRDLARPARRLLADALADGTRRSRRSPSRRSTRALFARARGARRAGVRAVRRRGLDGLADRDVGLRAQERADPRRLLRRSPPARPSSAAARARRWIASRPFFTSWVHVAADRAADDHHLADPAGRPRHQRAAGERQQRLGLLLERQRVGVEAGQEADGGRRVDRSASSATSSRADQHLRAVGQDLDHAVAERRDRLAQRRAALDAPPARELALGAARERGRAGAR